MWELLAVTARLRLNVGQIKQVLKDDQKDYNQKGKKERDKLGCEEKLSGCFFCWV